ncbi:YidB family protein [Kitasatospora sp. LaBMicrA B282]
MFDNLVFAHLATYYDVSSLEAVVRTMEAGGLGTEAASWVRDTANLPVTPEQIADVLPPWLLRKAADSLGLDTQEAARSLAAELPGYVDERTPLGELPRP